MQKLLAALTVAALVGVATPVNANAMDKNVEFFLDGFGLDAIPDGVADVYVNGVMTQMSIADALALAASRANGVDLAALAAAAGPTDLPAGYGDVWVLEFSNGGCLAPSIITASPVPATGFHEQLYTYAGAIGEMDSSGGSGIIVDWTTKGQTGGGYSGSVHIAGQSDFFCLYFFGFTLFFPYLDGAAYLN